MSLHLDTLFNKLWDEYHNLDEIIKWFDQEGFIVKRVLLGVIINYKPYIQLFKEVWHRQARGAILHYSAETDSWSCIRYMLPRGVEVLTSTHIEKGITSTENITESTKIEETLDKSQLNLLSLLKERKPINGYLSMKVDGMLLVVTLYTSSLKKQLLEQDDPLLQVLAKLSKPYEFMPVISTQKTCNVTDDRNISYIITALLLATVDAETIELAKQETPLTALEKYGADLMKSLNTFYNSVPEHEWISLSLEAVCPYNTCFWYPDEPHIELAVTYQTGFCKVLSYSTGLSNVVPHFMFSDLIAAMNLDEPYWWRISETTDIEIMIRDLSTSVLDCKSPVFTEVHKPSNRYSVQNRCIDPEGFIFWSDINSELDYHKIKTVEYYSAHSSKTGLTKLVALADSTSVFAAANKVKEFKQDLLCNLVCIVTYFRDIMRIENNYHIPDLFGYNPLEFVLDGMSDKARIAFNKQTDKQVQSRMILNSGSRSSKMILDMFEKHYAFNNPDVNVLKKLLMDIEPWSPDMMTKIIAIVNNLDALEKFYKLVK
jgi:hypothetical protein